MTVARWRLQLLADREVGRALRKIEAERNGKVRNMRESMRSL